MPITTAIIHKFPDALRIRVEGPITVEVSVKDAEFTPDSAWIEQVSTEVSDRLAGMLAPKFQEILTNMATLAEDELRLGKAVDDNTAAIKTLKDIDDDDKVIIADLKQQVADLKAAGTVDLSNIEGLIGKLEANNQTATATPVVE